MLHCMLGKLISNDQPWDISWWNLNFKDKEKKKETQLWASRQKRSYNWWRKENQSGIKFLSSNPWSTNKEERHFQEMQGEIRDSQGLYVQTHCSQSIREIHNNFKYSETQGILYLEPFLKNLWEMNFTPTRRDWRALAKG